MKKLLIGASAASRSKHLRILALLFGLCAVLIPSRAGAQYTQNNLVSDLPGMATFLDPNLVNPWGLASSTGSPIWASDNGMGVATLYNGAGVAQPPPPAQPLVVTVPAPSGSPAGTMSAPTGVVFNPTTGFGGSHFIFATEGGTIDAWTSGTSAIEAVPPTGGVYKGLALNPTQPTPQTICFTQPTFETAQLMSSTITSPMCSCPGRLPTRPCQQDLRRSASITSVAKST